MKFTIKDLKPSTSGWVAQKGAGYLQLSDFTVSARRKLDAANQAVFEDRAGKARTIKEHGKLVNLA